MEITSGALWRIAAAVVIALAIVLHALFPRYDFALMGESVIVFDRWTGAFQRATYGEDGEPRASSVLRPF